MKKVKQVYYDKDAVKGRSYATGLILELEDGTFLAHGSTDPLMPFEPMDELSLQQQMNDMVIDARDASEEA